MKRRTPWPWEQQPQADGEVSELSPASYIALPDAPAGDGRASIGDGEHDLGRAAIEWHIQHLTQDHGMSREEAHKMARESVMRVAHGDAVRKRH